MALTDVQIRNCKADGARRRLYDERGLYLEVTSGGGKWWRFKYRFDGKDKLISLGVYPDVPLAGRWLDDAKRKRKDMSGYLKGARDRRDEARELVIAGIDPSAARRDDKRERQREMIRTGTTFERVARDWLAHHESRWEPGTFAAIRASLENHVFAVLGDQPIDAIKPADVRETVKAIDARNASETAARVFQRIRAVYRYAISEELVEIDPTYPLKPGEFLKPSRVRHRAALAEKDMPAFLRALAEYRGDPATRAALDLLILTAVRPGEARGASWSEIDLERKLWRIPAARMKMAAEHLVPLSVQAVRVLESMSNIATGDLVFPSPFYPDKPISDGTFNSALTRLGYKGLVTAHGFRTTFSTAANEAGWRGDLIEKQLAHEDRDAVRAAYNRAQHVAERAKMMSWWANRLDVMRTDATFDSSSSGLAEAVAKGSAASRGRPIR